MIIAKSFKLCHDEKASSKPLFGRIGHLFPVSHLFKQTMFLVLELHHILHAGFDLIAAPQVPKPPPMLEEGFC